MCDLINREDVIKCLQENGWLDDTNIDELIETIPTAYDTGEVINELIKESKKLGIGFFPERKYIQEENAIEIVKRGYTKQIKNTHEIRIQWQIRKEDKL